MLRQVRLEKSAITVVTRKVDLMMDGPLEIVVFHNVTLSPKRFSRPWLVLIFLR